MVLTQEQIFNIWYQGFTSGWVCSWLIGRTLASLWIWSQCCKCMRRAFRLLSELPSNLGCGYKAIDLVSRPLLTSIIQGTLKNPQHFSKTVLVTCLTSDAPVTWIPADEEPRTVDTLLCMPWLYYYLQSGQQVNRPTHLSCELQPTQLVELLCISVLYTVQLIL